MEPKLSARKIALERCRGNMIPIPAPAKLPPLTERERRAIVSLRKKGLKYSEIAGVFSCSEATVWKVLANAMEAECQTK